MFSGIKEQIKILLQRCFILCAKNIDLASTNGPILVIAPHPDDESLACGATIARYRAADQQVRVVIVTDGQAAGRPPDMTLEQLVARRRKEAEDACRILGMPQQDVVFFEFPDQNSSKHLQAIESALSEQVRSLKPCAIFSPYIVDRHEDHRTVAAAVDNLCRSGAIKCRVYEYPVWFWSYQAVGHLLQPEKLRRTRRISTNGFLTTKRAAIAAYRSQYEAPVGDPDRFTFPPGFFDLALSPYELFFEKPRLER